MDRLRIATYASIPHWATWGHKVLPEELTAQCGPAPQCEILVGSEGDHITAMPPKQTAPSTKVMAASRHDGVGLSQTPTTSAI